MLGDALQVASMAGIHLAAVDALLAKALHGVVRRVSIGEAVGHDEIQGGPGFDALPTYGSESGVMDGEGEGGGAVFGVC